MPILRVKGGYKVANTTDKRPLSKGTAEAQLRAIEANKAAKATKKGKK